MKSHFLSREVTFFGTSGVFSQSLALINAAEVKRPTQPRCDATRLDSHAGAVHIFLFKAPRLTLSLALAGALRCGLILRLPPADFTQASLSIALLHLHLLGQTHSGSLSNTYSTFAL